jgi:hypothetical protein
MVPTLYHHRFIDGAPDAVTFLQNGSWVLGLSSSAGAEVLTSFFDEHLIAQRQGQELLSKVGQNGELNILNTLDLHKC